MFAGLVIHVKVSRTAKGRGAVAGGRAMTDVGTCPGDQRRVVACCSSTTLPTVTELHERRVRNWPAYDAGLRRGDLALWLNDVAIADRQAAPRTTPGGQAPYSDSASSDPAQTITLGDSRLAGHPRPPTTASSNHYHTIGMDAR